MELRAEHERWIDERETRVWGEWGVATLAATHWLTTEPTAVDGLPGLWSVSGGEVHGDGVRLAPGQQFEAAGLLLRGFSRDGSIALRVLDPGAPAARGISSIERFEFSEAARLRGRVRSTATTAETRSVDDHAATQSFDAIVELEWEGEPFSLTVQEDDGWYFAAFADGTAGVESHAFRFIRFPVPADGEAVVDFNRAYLPPCAFSDHYVCVMPVPGNRWPVPIRAGERLVR
ncbi:DUF1684 domain-containing protein [Agromyces sp. NPDC057679]|uniref:DUF1684 domain-containing protein n=1 Tax=Agromyces sp. NPDC057679 TaxID=3346207 RepID=UPI0036702B60